MRNTLRISLLLVYVLAMTACKKSYDERISALETKISSPESTPTDVAALIDLYQKAAQSAPEGPNYYQYLAREGDLLWNKGRNPAGAAEVLQLALKLNKDGLDKSHAAGTLAMVYKALREKSGIDQPETPYFLEIKNLLLQNKLWVDSALQVKRSTMVDAEMKLVKPEVVPALTDMIEGYVLALDTTDHAKTAGLLFEAANANRAAGNFARAISFYNTVSGMDADPQKAANSQFMMAFVFENDMHALPEAKIAYENFLKRFPKSEMAGDAKMALANLGKSPEELLKQFNK